MNCEETPVYCVDEIMIIRKLRSNVVCLLPSLCCIKRIGPLQRNDWVNVSIENIKQINNFFSKAMMNMLALKIMRLGAIIYLFPHFYLIFVM